MKTGGVTGIWALLVWLCVTPAASPDIVPPQHLLWIGNSLTTANSLPRTVDELSAAAGAPLVSTVVAVNDASLTDHWDRGDALKAIRRGGWDVVILQQGPSSLAESRAQLLAEARRFDAEIRGVGARTAFYMVWPPRDRLAYLGDVSRSYTEAAAAVHGLLLPVGDAWREAWAIEPSLALYGPDNVHPSQTGSILAAMVVVRGVTGKMPQAPAGPVGATLRAAVAAVFAEGR